jgi:hypothetical protein
LLLQQVGDLAESLSRTHLILPVFAVSKHLLSWEVFTLQPLAPGVLELENR